MGKGESGPGDLFDSWKQRLQCLWSEGIAWAFCPLLRCCPSLFNTTYILQFYYLCSVPCSSSWYEPWFPQKWVSSTAVLVQGALKQRVTVCSSCPLTGLAKSPALHKHPAFTSSNQQLGAPALCFQRRPET